MKTKIYVVSTAFSSRNITARNKKEAVLMFKKQLGVMISNNDKIYVNYKEYE